MTTVPPHRPAAEVEQALLALNDGSHPFEVRKDDDRIVAVWRHRLEGAQLAWGRAEWRYRVTLLDDSGEYTTSVVQQNWDGENTAFSFRSSDVTGPVDDVLARAGWTKRRNAVGRLLGRVLGRD